MPGLIGEDRFRAVAAAALDLQGVDGVEVLYTHEWGGLTRFANSVIHQSTFREDTGLRVRVVSRNRTGVASSRYSAGSTWSRYSIARPRTPGFVERIPRTAASSGSRATMVESSENT